MHDDQFTATGPPFPSGFEKAAFSTEASEATQFEWGVRVLSRRCGVVGQTTGGGVSGVYGHGRFSQFGVLGTAFAERIGVVGVSVTNTNDLMNLNVLPANVNLDSLGAGSGTGVFGKSGSGLGVHGMSTSNTGVFGKSGSGLGVHGASTSNTGVFGNSGSGLGVHGTSTSNTGVFGNSQSGIGSHGASDRSTGVLGTSESGFGVHGSSNRGPGGVFESASNAQVRLLPREMATPEGHVAGAGGELLATMAGGVFRLWFCTRAGDAASAAWDLVAGTRPFPGAPIAENATGIHVKRIQMRLNMVFGTDLNGDGGFGPITKEAVRAFQEQEGIAQTGIVDVQTWDRLFALT
jgi:hypothetical protein